MILHEIKCYSRCVIALFHDFWLIVIICMYAITSNFMIDFANKDRAQIKISENDIFSTLPVHRRKDPKNIPSFGETRKLWVMQLIGKYLKFEFCSIKRPKVELLYLWSAITFRSRSWHEWMGVISGFWMPSRSFAPYDWVQVGSDSIITNNEIKWNIIR